MTVSPTAKLTRGAGGWVLERVRQVDDSVRELIERERNELAVAVRFT